MISRSSFDIIGDVAVIEAETKEEENILKGKILKTHPNVKTILKRFGETRGTKRLRKYETIFKDNKKIRESGLGESETIHKEFGCSYKLDVKKVFFNPREGTIRNNIASLVKPGENVLVMFSGIGPYAILIAKRVDCHVVGIDINPIAVKYAEENVRVNKVQDKVELLQGDVNKLELEERFDRIIMPLGKTGYKFLDVATKWSKSGTVIHSYGLESDGKGDVEKGVRKFIKKTGKKLEILKKRRILPYAPGKWKVCLDIKVI